MMPRTLFLSHWDREALNRLVSELTKSGNSVFTNRQILHESNADRRADWRMSRILESDVFVFFAGPVGERQLIRSIELGFAIGAEVPLAFVGAPCNSYHRFGDVFRDEHDFLSAWHGSAASRNGETKSSRVFALS